MKMVPAVMLHQASVTHISQLQLDCYKLKGKLDALLDRDTGRRLRGEGLQLHPFFWGLDWAALQRRDIASPHAQYAGERAREAESAFAQWELEREAEADAKTAVEKWDGADMGNDVMLSLKYQ